MILLDTNVFIYVANGTIAAQTLKHDDIAFASVTKIEALGYAQITVAEQIYLEALFMECEQIDLEGPIVERAIKLRQQSEMSLGDAIVAATALECDCKLWTANEQNFDQIEGLSITNPLTGKSTAQ